MAKKYQLSTTGGGPAELIAGLYSARPGLKVLQEKAQPDPKIKFRWESVVIEAKGEKRSPI